MVKFQGSAPLLPTSSGRPLFIVIAALTSLVPLPEVYARRWEDVIVASIYAQSHVDLPRIQFAIEDNPQNVAPSAVLLSDSQPPSDAPSSVPSFYNQDEHEEESVQDPPTQECPQGEAAFRLNMYDSWGDGWGETIISIREVGEIPGAAAIEVSQHTASQDFATTARSSSIQKRSSSVRNNLQHRGLKDYVLIGGLKKGVFDSKLVCLSQGACYAVALQGGRWQEEARWEITPVDAEVGTSAASQNAIAKGRGMSNCTFYVAEDPMDKPKCPLTCHLPPPEQEPEKEEVDEAAEEEVGEVEADVIGQGAVDTSRKPGEDAAENGNALQLGEAPQQTSEPSLALREPSSAPSDAPSLVPTL